MHKHEMLEVFTEHTHRLSRMEIRVFQVLMCYANTETMKCWPNQDTIAEKLKCKDIKKITKAISSLVKKKLLKKKKSGRKLIYTLILRKAAQTGHVLKGVQNDGRQNGHVSEIDPNTCPKLTLTRVQNGGLIYKEQINNRLLLPEQSAQAVVAEGESEEKEQSLPAQAGGASASLSEDEIFLSDIAKRFRLQFKKRIGFFPAKIKLMSISDEFLRLRSFSIDIDEFFEFCFQSDYVKKVLAEKRSFNVNLCKTLVDDFILSKTYVNSDTNEQSEWSDWERMRKERTERVFGKGD